MSKKIADGQFMHRLNRKPSKNEIEQKMGKTYIPISILEAKLDSFFNGAWSTKNISTTIVGNELVVSLELHFYHPKLDTWLCRVGVGASMVMQKRDSAISDIDAKIKNALEMDAPNAKSKAFKNAVKSIGKAFGRDLMREIEGEFENIEQHKKTSENKILTALEKAKDFEELKKIFSNPNHSLALENEEIYKALEAKKIEIQEIENQKLLG